eukprot:XP_003972833.1 PREDICTED: WASH complex subunit CCDC53-like [Takifugu rubripes]
MDEDGLPLMGSGVDLHMVPAIQQRRIVAFFNQFVVHTVRFVNRFAIVCEEKLANISLRIQQIETTLSILEAKLSSIPGLEDVTVDGLDHVAQSNDPQLKTRSRQRLLNLSQTAPEPQQAEAPAENVMTVARDSRYARYLKMVQVGVPVMAIRNKMVAEGLDPNLLETPDAPVPEGGAGSTQDQDVGGTSSDSESSFSD